MNGKAFLDTNIIVYAFSSNDPRNARAEALLEAHSLHCPRGLTAGGSFIYHAMI
jgi:predicted nucleic acid-binding protein